MTLRHQGKVGAPRLYMVLDHFFLQRGSWVIGSLQWSISYIQEEYLARLLVCMKMLTLIEDVYMSVDASEDLPRSI